MSTDYQIGVWDAAWTKWAYRLISGEVQFLYGAKTWVGGFASVSGWNRCMDAMVVQKLKTFRAGYLVRSVSVDSLFLSTLPYVGWVRWGRMYTLRLFHGGPVLIMVGRHWSYDL